MRQAATQLSDTTEERGEDDPADGGFGKKSCDRFFQGDVKGPAEVLKDLYRLYFEMV